MDAVSFDPSACAAPAGLDLGPVAGSHPEKIVKFGIRLLTDEDWGEDVLQPSDDISAVGLITESVIRFRFLLYFTIRGSFYEGCEIGVEKIDEELLLDRDGSGAVKLFQKELVLELVILQLQIPAFEVELLEVI